eukprot:snap_masked-scaffold_6-processed-gene-9.21-mRNA-1 protein AED:1.00 eAED:1.00 QI:0/0/0/0/1/1/2/0/341
MQIDVEFMEKHLVMKPCRQLDMEKRRKIVNIWNRVCFRWKFKGISFGDFSSYNSQLSVKELTNFIASLENFNSVRIEKQEHLKNIFIYFKCLHKKCEDILELDLSENEFFYLDKSLHFPSKIFLFNHKHNQRKLGEFINLKLGENFSEIVFSGRALVFPLLMSKRFLQSSLSRLKILKLDFHMSDLFPGLSFEVLSNSEIIRNLQVFGIRFNVVADTKHFLTLHYLDKFAQNGVKLETFNIFCADIGRYFRITLNKIFSTLYFTSGRVDKLTLGFERLDLLQFLQRRGNSAYDLLSEKEKNSIYVIFLEYKMKMKNLNNSWEYKELSYTQVFEYFKKTPSS